MALRLHVLERFFRNMRGTIGLLRQGGANDPRMIRMQEILGDLEQTLYRCRSLCHQIP